MDEDYLASRFQLARVQLDLTRHPDEPTAVNAALDRLAAVNGHVELSKLDGAPEAAYAYAQALVARRKRTCGGFAVSSKDFAALRQGLVILSEHFEQMANKVALPGV